MTRRAADDVRCRGQDHQDEPRELMATDTATHDPAPTDSRWPLIGVLAGSVLLLHGPVDIALVAIAEWHLEQNPLIQWLGWPVWLAIKTVGLLGVVFVVTDARRNHPRDPTYQALVLAFLFANAMVAVFLIIPNFAYAIGITG